MVAQHEIAAAFSADGPLARAIPGYSVRPQQARMAERVAEAMRARGALVAEAGTGTGKTFAYLVPALLSGGKVIVSTGTKTLQDQLYQRDLPTVREALGVPVTSALLKGRANYVCHYHLERALEHARLRSREESAQMREIERFARRSATGDRAELAGVPEDSAVWAWATSTRENCLGQECRHHGECFVLAARRQALAADLVVVNHHLFFADVMLKDEGAGELLPMCNAVIFDEAHQLPRTAALFFGESVSTSQLAELARDARTEGLASAPDFAPLQRAADALLKAGRDLRLAIPEENLRLAAAQAAGRAAFAPALGRAAEAIGGLAEALAAQAERSEGLASCLERAHEVEQRVRRWRSDEAPELVRWVEVFTQALQLHATPLDVSPVFRREMSGHPRAWIFTSATLSVGGDFSHYQAELGLEEAETGCWESPFDYPAQGLLYVPADMPDANAHGYADSVADAAFPVIRASGGGAFVLCTSLRGMRWAWERLRARFDAEAIALPLLRQDEGSRSELLERFRRLGNAVLVASHSFWEGVDVRGDALRLVVIDRLPFAPPDDPVLAARIEHYRRSGRNAFAEYQLPQAVIALKQGAGRLIRDETDRGVLMVCDTRLVSRPYGRTIWRSLPPMRRTRDLAEVARFFAAPESAGTPVLESASGAAQG